MLVTARHAFNFIVPLTYVLAGRHRKFQTYPLQRTCSHDFPVLLLFNAFTRSANTLITVLTHTPCMCSCIYISTYMYVTFIRLNFFNNEYMHRASSIFFLYFKTLFYNMLLHCKQLCNSNCLISWSHRAVVCTGDSCYEQTAIKCLHWVHGFIELMPSWFNQEANTAGTPAGVPEKNSYSSPSVFATFGLNVLLILNYLIVLSYDVKDRTCSRFFYYCNKEMSYIGIFYECSLDFIDCCH